MDQCLGDGGPGTTVPWALFAVSIVINIALVGVLLFVLRVLKQCSDGSTKASMEYTDISYTHEPAPQPGLATGNVPELTPPPHSRTHQDTAAGQEDRSPYAEIAQSSDPGGKYENVRDLDLQPAAGGVKEYEGLGLRPIYGNTERPPVYQELKPK